MDAPGLRMPWKSKFPRLRLMVKAMSERGKYYWLKLNADFFDDKVIKYLRKLPEGPTLVIIYLKMQLKSLKTEGFLRYDGILPTCEEELALVLDESPMLVTGAINALEKMGVVERWENDTLYMKAMQELIGSESASAARVRKHREMKKLQEESTKVLPSNGFALLCNAGVTECNTEIERREKREEIETEIEDQDPPDDERPASPAHISVPYEQIKSLYNQICVSFPKCTAMSEARKKAIKARFSSGYTLEDFRRLFEKTEASRFMKGANSRNWRATFDWLIKDGNMAKVLDGNYDDHDATVSHGPAGGQQSTGNQFLDMLREEEDQHE